MICGAIRTRLLAELADIVRDFRDDPAAGGLEVVVAMKRANAHWPTLLPPMRGGYRIEDLPMLDLVGVAVFHARNLTPFKLATLAVIAAKPASIECRGTFMQPNRRVEEDRKLVIGIVDAAMALEAEDRLCAPRYGAA